MGTYTLALQLGRSENLHGTKMIVTVKCRGLIYIRKQNSNDDHFFPDDRIRND